MLDARARPAGRRRRARAAAVREGRGRRRAEVARLRRSRTPSTTTQLEADELYVAQRVGRRRPDPQVGSAARTRPVLPDPQAHVARHDHRSSASTPRSSRSGAGATSRPVGARRSRSAGAPSACAVRAQRPKSRSTTRSRRRPVDDRRSSRRDRRSVRGRDVDVDDAIDESRGRSPKSRPTKPPKPKPTKPKTRSK